MRGWGFGMPGEKLTVPNPLPAPYPHPCQCLGDELGLGTVLDLRTATLQKCETRNPYPETRNPTPRPEA